MPRKTEMPEGVGDKTAGPVTEEQDKAAKVIMDSMRKAATRQAAKAGDAGRSKPSSVPKGHNPALDGYGGPRIVINPSTFRNEKDGLCVTFDEAFRILMEVNGFDPVAEPTERQREFFSDTAYANDERMMRRTILARICTFDTSVTDPTDEQLQEAVEFLETVMEIGAPQNQWEQRAVRRIRDAIAASVGQPRAERPAPEPPNGSPANAAGGGGQSEEDDAQRGPEPPPGQGKAAPEDVAAFVASGEAMPGTGQPGGQNEPGVRLTQDKAAPEDVAAFVASGEAKPEDARQATWLSSTEAYLRRKEEREARRADNNRDRVNDLIEGMEKARANGRRTDWYHEALDAMSRRRDMLDLHAKYDPFMV